MKYFQTGLGVMVIFAVALVAGCSSVPKVTRAEIDKTIDLSGKWNDSDSRLVSETMIKDCLSRSWLNNFNEKTGGRLPVVIVGTITNRSSEHIDSQVFTKDLEMNLLNSGKVIFVVNRTERAEVRDEREDQNTSGNTDPATINPKGKETGADFLLQGSIHSIVDEVKGKFVILYQVNLELINLTTNQKAWIGQKEIKKFVERSRYSL